ncbi:sulfatase family protein [Persicitalea jodogahamensis]|uniref:Arylsulfatase n=1 Tax=Persicitalea jodogahamensis TaxID=402147 RepID=A0A8J3D3G6_9BACT|nr:sulfatase-like hydrolase/transferase [Persicitalea jodogahamensis]GHB65423.1 arylsulfatase [Persicitalea jodogahamensis]
MKKGTMSTKHNESSYRSIPALALQSVLLSFLTVLGVCAGGASTEGPGKNAPHDRPNVLFILTDDMGYGDLSAYGSPVNHTPNLDKLAGWGMKMGHCYAGSAVCTPSRASIFTGRFPLRYDIQWAFTDNEEYLPVQEQSIPKLLKAQGYQTAHIGKWHLGGIRIQDFEARAAGKPANPGPHEHGFDHYLCNIEDPIVRKDLISNRLLYREGGTTMVRNDRRVPPQAGNWETIKVDEALAFMQKSRKDQKPFFVNLWFDTPHTPYEPIEPFVEEFAKRGATSDQLYVRSMIKHLDTQVGRLLEYLDKNGLRENTIIIFGSDNGAATQLSPGPFQGHKTDLHDGGIRVPFFVSWAGKIPAQSYSFQQTHYTDLLPTLCEALRIPYDKSLCDGQSLWPQWQGARDVARKTMLWQMDITEKTGYQGLGGRPLPVGSLAAQRGKWKMLATEQKPVALYDTEAQYREYTNLLGTQPEVEQSLWAEILAFYQAKRKGWKEANP